MSRNVSDLVVSASVFALGVTAIAASGSWEQGAWKFPIVTAVVLVTLAVCLALRSARAADAPSFKMPSLDVVLFVVLACLYVGLMPRIGFLVSSAVFLFLMAWFLAREQRGRGVVNGAVFAVIATAAIYGLFALVLGVPLP